MKHVFAPHQRQAMRYAEGRRTIALFMEMRLGKSPVAIRWAQSWKPARVLLVAPLTTLLGTLNWQGELRREGISPQLLSALDKDKRMTVLRPSRLSEGRLTRAWARGWFAVNYEALRTQPELLDAPWDVIILDESTRIRSPQAQVTKLLISDRIEHIEHRAILTGLPNPEDPMDYVCQFLFLDGHFMGFRGREAFWQVRHKLFYQGYSAWDWVPNPGTRDKIRSYVHSRAFVLTRKQAKVGSAKVRQQRSVELNGAQRKLLKEIKTRFEIEGTETKWQTVVHTWMQRIAGGFHPTTLEVVNDAKIKLAESLVMDEFRDEPLVMWFRFNEELEHVYRYLQRKHKKLGIAYVHGGIDKRQRPKIQEQFQRGDLRVILLQVKLGRYGWNLSRSSTAIYYSNSYEFEDRSQSEDRIIHLTKREDCLYLDLVSMGTPDEDVVDSLSEKRMNARAFSRRVNDSMMRWVA